MKPYCMTIQMKAIEQYFHVVLFIMLYNVVCEGNFSVWPFKLMRAFEEYFHVLCKGALTFESVDEAT